MEHEKYKGDVCLSCINDLAFGNDLYFELNDYDDETIIFSIIDENSSVLDKNYRFNFANKYKIK